MSRHRAAPPPRRPEPAGRRRAPAPGPVRPRYGRLAALGASVSVTAVALLGGTGVLPSVATEDDSPSTSSSGDNASTMLSAADASATPTPSAPSDAATDAAPVETPAAVPTDPAVPADSGEGKRVVFDQSDQRVWLVNDDEEVVRTYLVSGSASDNLEPGTFEVYSRSANAVGIDDSGTMQYFVRFTQGTNGAAIGFHDIPVDEGEPVQTVEQLGTPLSHGCIRQARKDALALWGFAPIGTAVTVTA